HLHRFDEVASLLDRSGLSWQRRSQLQPSDPRLAPTACRILLIDTIGELSAWWGAASIGFVGGSLHSTRGGQNMIEPAAYGVATCSGPNTQNFRDVVELLLTSGAAARVTSAQELTAFVRRCLEDPPFASELGARAAALVYQQQGATIRTWSLLEPLIPAPGEVSKPVDLSRDAA